MILYTFTVSKGLENILDTYQQKHIPFLSWLAEEERERTKKRKREGIAEAKKAGKHLGRPKATFTDEFIEAYQQWKSGNITAVKAIELSHIGKSTFYRLVKKYEEVR